MAENIESSAASPVSRLGDQSFKEDYGLTYAYLAGAMHRGISSAEMLIRLGKKGMLGFFGTAGLPIREIEQALFLLRRHSKMVSPTE
nr:hypothetical protein P5646_17155 [Bacillus velezensis]